MANNPPRLSVLTAVYNGEAYIDQAVASILAQTYTDFEYILIDDASTDSTPQKIAGWAGRDGRIRTLRNQRSANPAGALNCGLSLAVGEYIAILDGDDLAYPQRFAQQVAYLDGHPQVGVVGGQVQRIDQDGRALKLMSYPTHPTLVRWVVFFQTPVLHSAAMMRRALVEKVGGYSVQHSWMTDYDLFARLMEVSQVTNLPDCLAAYRINTGQVSSVHKKPQSGQVLLLICRLLFERLELRAGLNEIQSMYLAVRSRELPDEAALLGAAGLLGEMYTRFTRRKVLDEDGRELVCMDCAKRWHRMAVVHQTLFPEASQEILRRALELDPLAAVRFEAGAGLL